MIHMFPRHGAMTTATTMKMMCLISQMTGLTFPT
jgi:hypothetical protein